MLGAVAELRWVPRAGLPPQPCLCCRGRGKTWVLPPSLEQRWCALNRSVSVDAGEVNSISVDWFTGQLYWASSHPTAICAGLGNGRGYVTVLGKDVAPEQLTVHPAAR